ncbi:MAG: TldD/PmbA family protein [Clostridia bacterium]|nr:TldD/PmbA family protein [Clostridia bacterium]
MNKITILAREILEESQRQGADYAQCSVSESEKKEFNVDGGRFSLMRTLYNRNVTITVLKDHRKGTIQINRFDEDTVKTAVRDALDAAESGKPDPAWEYARGPVEQDFTEGQPECNTDRLFERTKELLETIGKKHPKILMEQMITSHDSGKVIYANTNGVTYRSRWGAYSFSLMYSGHEGEKSTSFYGSDVMLKTLDKPVIDCGFIERDLAMVEKQLDPKPLEGKFTGPVVLAPYALSEIVLWTIMGNFVSDSCMIDGTSIWKDKLGETVADPRFSMSFEPYSDDVIVPSRYTGEGYPTENFDLIKDGKLVSFCLSQYGANKTGGRRAGNDGSSMIVRSGEKALDEIIAGIDRGILVMRFSGGSPAPSGEYSGVAKNSFMIENGKITNALTETMISGCVPDMLMQIREISSDTLKDGNGSLPFIAFDGVTISGK